MDFEITAYAADQIIRKGAIKQYEDYLIKGRFFDYGFPTYNLLLKMGYLNLSDEQREELREEARRLTASAEDNGFLQMIRNPRNTRAISERYEYILKYLTVRLFFESIRLSGESIKKYV